MIKIYFKLYILVSIMIAMCVPTHAKDSGISTENPGVVLNLDISEILKEQDIHAIYEDTRVIGFNLKTKERYINDYYADGSVKSKRKNKTWRGIWYTDSKGQHCIRWNHKDTADCELIGLDDEGNWVKFKDESITKEIEAFKEIPDATKH